MNDLKGIIEDCNKSDLVSDKIIKKIIEIIGQEEWQDLHDENNDICTTMGELIITLKGIADLEKENTELKCNCRTCVYEGSPCIRSDYPSKKGVCSHYKNVFEENVELKEENKVLAQNLEDTEIINKTYEKRFSDLEKENAELKTKVTALENANRAMIKELDDTTSGGLNILQNVVKNKEELATAKEIISEYINILNGDTKNWKKTQEKAEQFLNSEVENVR